MDLAKDRVFLVEGLEVRSCRDEELARIEIGALVRHRDNTDVFVFQCWDDFVFEIVCLVAVEEPGKNVRKAVKKARTRERRGRRLRRSPHDRIASKET